MVVEKKILIVARLAEIGYELNRLNELPAACRTNP